MSNRGAPFPTSKAYGFSGCWSDGTDARLKTLGLGINASVQAFNQNRITESMKLR